ncbi:hypothetical protein COCON_G00118550 [Conger conger]|uniref:Lipase maturation factor n=1 Tax=Conger conger TaxID=82655 RepID=A0A9Q1DGB9_CONCO|nr:lipase maturation factor 2-like [Conger conger]KAJ8269248.1 hypothetical protein COCON_G00118550 [Conger conger]
MGEIILPRQMFLWSMSVIYMFAFASLYIQIPGLYGNDGILPARWLMRYTGKGLLEQLQDSPTLLWLGPRFGLDTQQGMELICLLGALLSLGAMVLEALRNSIVFFCLWALYLSLFQVGQVFLYFQWDSLLLETGFLAVLIAPLGLLRAGPRQHDGVTFWLARWLLFRLMFASGVVKLTSRCPTWWGLTALTYHYETQCIPTPLAWFAHQLPVWVQKLSVVCTFVIEIAVPFLFFSPLRSLRLGAFYMQLLLQILIILTGNYNFFNLLTIMLCFSLLDDDHVGSFIGRRKKAEAKTWPEAIVSRGALLSGLCVSGLMAYLTVVYFNLEVDWEKASVSSQTAFTHYQFNKFLKTVTIPSIWIGALSLTWEIIKAMFRCASVRRAFRKLSSIVQWAIFTSAAVCMFGISTVPYTLIEHQARGEIWPVVSKAYNSVGRYQLVNSYGLFRRMTGVGGRPEVVIEGSMDGETWTEIEFMYKPGNLSGPPPLLAPHQPRLDWQMWFAALRPHTQSPWFTGLVHGLLQGRRDVIDLIQVEESRYPFSHSAPAFIRARLYKYWFTQPREDGSLPQQWWRRRYVEDFYPTVHLGDPVLESLLSQHGLKNKGLVKRVSNILVPRALGQVRAQIRGLSGPLVLWSLFATGASIIILRTLSSRTPRAPKPEPDPVEPPGEKAEEVPCPTPPGPEEEEEEEEKEKEKEKEEHEKEVKEELANDHDGSGDMEERLDSEVS